METATAMSRGAKEEGGWFSGGEEKSEEGEDETGPPRTKFDGEKESDIQET
jgi:hypothetical protein